MSSPKNLPGGRSPLFLFGLFLLGGGCFSFFDQLPVLALAAFLGGLLFLSRLQVGWMAQLGWILKSTLLFSLFLYVLVGLPFFVGEYPWNGVLFISETCFRFFNDWIFLAHEFNEAFFSDWISSQHFSREEGSQYFFKSIPLGFLLLAFFFLVQRFFHLRFAERGEYQLRRLTSQLERGFEKVSSALFSFWFKGGLSSPRKPFLGGLVFSGVYGGFLLNFFLELKPAEEVLFIDLKWFLSFLSFLPCLGFWLGSLFRFERLQRRFEFLSPPQKDAPLPSEGSSSFSSSGFYLGKKASQVPFSLTEQNLAYHVEVVAPTGSGKTNLLKNLILDRIQKGQGVLFLDFKAEFSLVSWIYEAAKENQREKDLRLLSLAHPELSVPYNPFKSGDATDIHSALMNAMTWSEPFYRGVSSMALMTVVRALCEYQKKTGELFHLRHLYELLTDPSRLRIFISRLEKVGCSGMASELFSFSSRLEKPREKESLMGLVSNLNQLLFSSAGNLISVDLKQESFDFKRAISENQIGIFLMNSLKLKESASLLGKLLLQDLMSLVGNTYSEGGPSLASPVTLIIDEFASFATPSFIEFMDRARGAGIGIVMAHQARADLKSVSPEFQERVEANSNTMIVSGIKSSQDAEFYAGILGTQAVLKRTTQMESGLFWMPQRTGLESLREADEFIIHPNELKSLSQGQVFCVSRTIDPRFGIVRTQKAREFTENREEVLSFLRETRACYLEGTKGQKIRYIDLTEKKRGGWEKSGTLSEEREGGINRKALEKDGEGTIQVENEANGVGYEKREVEEKWV